MKKLKNKQTLAKKKDWDKILAMEGPPVDSIPEPYPDPIQLDFIPNMLSTKWRQQYGFNQFCPTVNNQLCPAGCTAVALAQILHFWGCQTNPQGSHTYIWNCSVSVDFADAGYNWEAMADSTPDEANARLIADCGIALNMRYTADWSFAAPEAAANVMKNYFGFSESTDIKLRFWHLRTWENMIKTELAAGRPVLYGALDLEGNPFTGDWNGHSWVICGFDGVNEYYCNWGWSPSYNDFYALDAFDTDLGQFDVDEQAIFGASPIPLASLQTPNLSAQTIQQGANTIEISPVSTATSYDWITTYGTINGTDNSVTLTTSQTTTVGVKALRAYDGGFCTQNSSWAYATMTMSSASTAYISGPSLVCSSSAHFSMMDLPSNASVTWSKSSNLDWLVPPDNNGCYVVQNGSTSGNGWITATVVSGSSTSNPTITVWVGNPTLPTITCITQDLCAGIKTYQVQNLTTVGAQSTTWSIQGSITILSYTDTTCTISIQGEGYLKAQFTNTCGYSETNLFITFICPTLQMSPNPANTEIEVNIIDPQNNSLVLDYQLLTSFGIQRKQLVSDNKKEIFNVTDLPNGTYMMIVRFRLKDNSLRQLSGDFVISR